MAKFVLPKFSRGAVNRAGDTLRDGASSQLVLDRALSVINNWRASHRYPLHVMYLLLRDRAQKIDEHALVSQRLKRLSSIQKKLSRRQTEAMELSRMQDIGGCRAVVRDIAALDSLVGLFEVAFAKNPHRHVRVGQLRDYVATPKADGYRSLHYVLQYKATTPQNAPYDGHRIEIQLRTKLQHAWATALETVDMLTAQGLKFALNEDNVGDPKWKRFFCLMASAIARREHRPLTPGTPENFKDLVKELREISAELRITQILSGVAAADAFVGGEKGTLAVLLVLHLKERKMNVIRFNKNDIDTIDDRYLDYEKSGDSNIQVVQVFMNDLHALRQAYPNFYLDTRSFVQFYDQTVRSPRARSGQTVT